MTLFQLFFIVEDKNEENINVVIENELDAIEDQRKSENSEFKDRINITCIRKSQLL